MPNPTRYPHISPFAYEMGRTIFTLMYTVATRRHVTGKENIPESGPLIIATNHLSQVDVPFMAIEIPHHMYALAAEKYERHLFRFILRMGGAIFIQRGEIDRKALRQALNVLEDGKPLAVAVEGTRSHTGGLIEGKTGAAYLATRSGAPILPTVMWGTEKAYRNLSRLRRTDLYAAFGPLIHLPQGQANSGELDRYTEHLMLSLAALLPPSYRGLYAAHPRLPEYLNSRPPNP